MNWDTTSSPKNYLKQIDYISVESTEIIKKSYVKSFLKTQLSLAGVDTTNIHIFYTLYNSRYEIYYYNSTHKQFTPYDYVMSCIEHEKLEFNDYTLYSHDDYFIVLYNKKLFCLRKNNGFCDEDIKKYVEKIYDISISTTIKITNKELVVKQYTKYVKETTYYKYLYVGYLVTLLFLMSVFFFQKSISDGKIQPSIVVKKVLSTDIIKNNNHLKHLENIFKVLVENSLLVLTYKYDTKIYLTIQGNKKDLFQFVNTLQYKIIIKRYEKLNKSMVIEIEI